MTIATLGGRPLLATGPISWPLREGVTPVIQSFDMTPEDAQAVMDSDAPLTLIIKPDGGGTPVTVQYLYPINLDPGEDRFISRVQVADRRVWWSYRSPGPYRMNMRRNVGTKRLIANNQVPAVNPTASKVAYWAWSLDSGSIWTAQRMLQVVINAIGEAEQSMNGFKAQLKIDDRIGSKIKSLPIEDLVLDDAGDQMAMRVMSYLPEGMLYVDYDGSIVITSKATGDEKAIIQSLQPEIAGEGHVDLVKNDAIRPRGIECLYTREIELVFDFSESGSTSITSGDTVSWPGAANDSRIIENVLPSPDYQLTVNGQTITQGTWITFDQAFLAWGALPSVSRNGQGVYLGHDILQKCFVPGMDGWGMLGISGNEPDNSGVTKPWMARFSACKSHYRTTFRISPKYMDRILSIRAYRVATLDPQSGTRSPAAAYGDYCVLYTQQTLLKQSRFANTQDGSPDWITNKTAYPSSGVLDSTAEVSPATVTIVDADQGIIHIDYMPNPIFGMNETILPSQMTVGTLPTADISNRTRPISFDSVIGSRIPPSLSPSFQLKVILSAVPAAPSGNQQLHKIKVQPSDVESMLPNSQTAGLGNCLGPVMQIRIGPQVEVARVAWNDASSAELDKCFGLGDGTPNLSGLVINEDAPSDLTNGASLNAIAKAAAARIYASLADRFEGSMAGYMNGGTKPAGWIGEVKHTLAPDGMATTSVSLPQSVPQLDLFAFLDSASRQAILKLVQPQ